MGGFGAEAGVDLVAGGKGTPVVVLGCEGGPQGFSHPPSTRRVARAHRGGKRLLVVSAMTDKLGVADPTDGQ